jgi:hypothetical protein
MMKLTVTKQCKKCPWLVSTNPHEIPNGYCESRHRQLRKTIAQPDSYDFSVLRVMACHESQPGSEYPCVGWLHHQLGPGNNIALRLAMMGNKTGLELLGPQHETFEDTLPK